MATKGKRHCLQSPQQITNNSNQKLWWGTRLIPRGIGTQEGRQEEGGTPQVGQTPRPLQQEGLAQKGIAPSRWRRTQTRIRTWRWVAKSSDDPSGHRQPSIKEACQSVWWLTGCNYSFQNTTDTKKSMARRAARTTTRSGDTRRESIKSKWNQTFSWTVEAFYTNMIQ